MAVAVGPLLAMAAAAPAEAHARCFVLPYAGAPSGPWWGMWHVEPVIAGNVLLLGGLYAWGLGRLWRSAGAGRGVSRGRAVAFALGLGALALALMSPMDGLASELAWVHMVQHMTLMVVAAPLLVLGRPGVALIWALPERPRRALASWRARRRAALGWLWHPLGPWAAFALVLWIWHLPGLYEAALRHAGVHDAQHLTFFGVSCLFWRLVADPLGRRWLPPLLGVVYLFTTSLHATLLGVFMALAPRPWYPAYALTAPGWKLSPLADQQLAGLIMWMPACMAFSIAGVWLVADWLRGPDRPTSGPAPSEREDRAV
jgi:putative membrane protein